MQLTIFGDDASRAALSTNIFISKEPVLMCPFQKQYIYTHTEATEKQCMPPCNCIVLSIYVCTANTPENFKCSDKDEGDGNVIQKLYPTGFALHSPTPHPHPSFIPPVGEEASRLAAAFSHHQLSPIPSPFIYCAEQAG